MTEWIRTIVVVEITTAAPRIVVVKILAYGVSALGYASPESSVYARTHKRLLI